MFAIAGASSWYWYSTSLQPSPNTSPSPSDTESPNSTSDSTLGYSRFNPASAGATLEIRFPILLNWYKARVTLLEVIRGDEAWSQIEKVNSFNDPPKEGFEYILAKIHFEYLEGTEPDSEFYINPYYFMAVSQYWVEYENVIVFPPKPEFSTGLYPGASSDGWRVFQVAVNDSKPLMTFGRYYDGTGGIWFKLY